MKSEEEPDKPSHVVFILEHGRGGIARGKEIGAMWPVDGGGYGLSLGTFDLAAVPRELIEKAREEQQKQQREEPEHGPTIQ